MSVFLCFDLCACVNGSSRVSFWLSNKSPFDLGSTNLNKKKKTVLPAYRPVELFQLLQIVSVLMSINPVVAFSPTNHDPSAVPLANVLNGASSGSKF